MRVTGDIDRTSGALLPVLTCFGLSGFAALLYQTVWTREFAFVFGTSELAVATVLAAYMGGLSAGAAVAGRLAPRIRRPVLVYALLELGIGATAMAVPLAIGASTRLAVALFGGAAEPPDASGLALPGFYLAASFAIVMVPTGLMGATLPLLARHAVRNGEELGSRIGLLYAANTAGAVLGTLCAAFLLLPALGLRASVAVGAGVNVAVFGLAAWIARRAPVLEPAETPRVASVAEADGWRGRRVLPLILVSGAVSFVYEVLWTRLLGHVLGGSVHAFATMLATFLLGITLGSALASRRASTPETAARGFAAVQIGIALTSLLAFAGLDALPGAAQALGAGARGSLGASALLAGAVLLPSTLFIGATFPLAVRVLARGAADAATATARVYAWNTLGAILGAVGGGFFVIPALGYADTVLVCAVSSLLVAIATAVGVARGAHRPALAAALLLLALAVVRPGEPTTLLRTSPLALQPLAGELTFLGVGRSATVVLLDNGRSWRLRTNGMPEARIVPAHRNRSDEPPRWMGSLPTIARPELESLLFVGLGGARQLENISPGVRRIDVIELEPEVVAANRAVAHARDPDPLSDPRLLIHVNDARGALVLTERRWDGIVSQPSHPWTAGASHLYTREFFELVRDRLTPGGVFVQWIGFGTVDASLLRSLLATLNDVFPHVRVFRPGPRALWLFLASEAPLPVESSLARARMRDAANLDALGLYVPEDLAFQSVLDARGSRRFAEGAPVIRDDRNLMQMGARRALRDPVDSESLEPKLAPLDPLVPPGELDPVLLVRRLLEIGQVPRAVRVAQSAADLRGRSLALALVAAHEDRSAGEAALRAILDREPGAVGAREALVLLLQGEIAGGDPEALAVAAGLAPPARAVVEGWRRVRAKDWQSLRALEPELGRVAPQDTLYRPAVMLRIRWRLEAGDRAQAAEAVGLADLLLARARLAQYSVLRAWALAAAGFPEPALGDLEDLAGGFGRGGGESARSLVAGFRRALAYVPRSGPLGARRARLERRVVEGGPPSPGS